MRKLLAIMLSFMLVAPGAWATQKYEVVQTNFTSGELSPKLFGRIDTKHYYNGAAELTNFYVQPYGGAFTRPGTVYVAETKYPDKATRLIPFNFNNEDTYVIEMGDEYMRFYRNSAQVQTDAAPSEDAYTRLLSEFEGDDGDTSYTAETAQEITFVNGAEIDTAYDKFGTASAYMDGTNDYLTIPDSSDWDIALSEIEEYTIDLWVKFADHTGTEDLISQYLNVNNFWTLTHVDANGFKFFVYASPGTEIVDTGYGGEITDTNWHHVAMVKSISGSTVTYTLYVDGVSVCSTDDNSTISYAGKLHIGQRGNAANYFSGHIDEVRISKGIARWTSNFTAPTYAYTGAATWVTATSYAVDDYAKEDGTVYKCLVAHTSGTFATDLAAEYWSSTEVYEIATPYTEDEVFDIKYVQSADIVYLAHENHAPAKLSRTDHDAWTLGDIDFEYGPFMPENDTDTTLNPGATTGVTTLVATNDVFTDDHIDAFFSIGGETGTPAHQGYVKIINVTDARNAYVEVQSTLDGASATTTWAEGSFSDDAGYPAGVAFFEQRLFWGGTTEEPQTVWGSQTADYYNMEDGSDSADALVYQLFSQQVNQIRWLNGESKVLVIGTSDGPFQIWSGSTSEPLTPTSVSAKKISSFGTNDVSPVRIDNHLFYVQRGGEHLRDMFYQYEIDGYSSNDASVLSDHLLDNGDGVTDMAYQKLPIPIIWCVLDSGDIAIYTKELAQEVQAWARIEGGGTGDHVCGVPVEFESVAVVPNGDEDQVWSVMQWNWGVCGGGGDSRYKQFIVYFDTFEVPKTEMAYRYNFLDCALVESMPTPVADVYTVDGLDYLDGADVVCWADGAYLGHGIVTDGEVEISDDSGDTYSKLLVGLPYTRKIKLLPPEFKANPFSSTVRKARVYAIYVKAYRSSHIDMQSARYNTTATGGAVIDYDFDIDNGEDYYAQNEDLIGKYFHLPLSGWSRDTIVIIGNDRSWTDEDQAYSLNILSVTLFVALGG